MHDAPLDAHEHTEHAVHAHDPFVSRVAVTVAILAVLAAAAGSLETVEGGRALEASSEATLAQDKATDAWSEYEAESLKRHLYEVAGDMNTAATARYQAAAEAEAGKQDRIRKDAKSAEAESGRLLGESRHHENRHHWLTGAATLFEVAIALSTVAIITRRKWLWSGSTLLGGVGIVVLAVGYAM